MDIPLRERNADSTIAELFFDEKAHVALDDHFFHVGVAKPYPVINVKYQGTVAEIVEYDNRFRLFPEISLQVFLTAGRGPLFFSDLLSASSCWIFFSFSSMALWGDAVAAFSAIFTAGAESAAHAG